MKNTQQILAAGVAAIGLLSAGAAHATKTDSLTGPDSGDVTMVQSALTSTPTDSRSSTTSPYVMSNTSDSYGNQRFGAGYSAFSETYASPGGYSLAYNSASVTATANYDRKTPLQVTVYAATNQSTSSANVYAYVYSMGNLVRNGSRGGAQFNGATYLTSLSTDFWKSPGVSYNVFSFVDVTASARVYGTANQSVYGTVWNDGIDATLSQGGDIRAEVTGGLSVLAGGVSGGVSVKDLKLTSVSLPLTATAKWWGYTYSPGNCVSWVNLGERYSLSLQWLSGRVVLWGKIGYSFISTSGDYEIANWPGITQARDIANFPAQWQQIDNSCLPDPGTAPVVNGIIIG